MFLLQLFFPPSEYQETPVTYILMPLIFKDNKLLCHYLTILELLSLAVFIASTKLDPKKALFLALIY